VGSQRGLNSPLLTPHFLRTPHSPEAAVDDEAIPKLNYYNYFTEVEEAFVRRRGAHMLVSPLDWALIETWKEVGVPLHVALRGIERSFDAYDARPNRHRRVNSIFYCQQEVENCYGEYRRALVGSAETTPSISPVLDDGESPFPRARVERHLREAAERVTEARKRAESLGLSGLVEEFARAGVRLAEIVASLEASARLDSEGLERDLTSLEELMLKAVTEHAPSGQVDAERDSAKAQLKGYKKGMDKEVYTQTLDKLVARRLREIYYIPRLSLFFME
jgi:hypothetical protein